MRYRVLVVGIDVDLLMIRQVLLTSWGYDSLIATPEDVDEKLQSGRFDLVILSVMLSQEEKRRIQAKLPAGIRTLALRTLIWPEELRCAVAEALSGNPAPAKPI
jgi:CheY-like chemotaxis protein